MNSECNHKNPLQRSGVNQYERVLHALSPNYVKVDERDHADLILFAKQYAAQLNYFNTANMVDGDWQPFMAMDLSVTLASLMKLKVQGCFTYVKDIFEQLKAMDVSNAALLKERFKVLFDVGFSITSILNEYYNQIPVDFEFRAVLGNAVQSSLQEYYKRLKQYYDNAIAQNLIDTTSTTIIDKPPIKLILAQDFNESSLNPIWFDGSLPVFTPTFKGSTASLKIKNTSTHNLFTGIFDQYLKTLARIVEQTSTYLDKTLSDFPTHSPHYALFLAFIKLFRYAQDHVNNFSKRHLDLYYKEILRIVNKAPEPDKVHLAFELAKGVNQHLLKRDTVFKAGKDVDGLEIFYALTEDIVLNKGAVKSLQSIYVDKNITNKTFQVFASPVAKSEDGQGGKLLSVDKSWKAFGDNTRTAASIGFVVASHYLYLTEGVRTITFKFYAPGGEKISFLKGDVATLFSLQLSGKKGWVDVNIDPAKVDIDASKEFFSITVSLDGGEQPIVPYAQKIHQYNFATSLPVAKFIVKNAIAKEQVWNFAIDKIGIDVTVKGMRNISIQNDAGNLSASKPFDLFGSEPRVGSSFIIGSKEIFMKTLQPLESVKAKINFVWDNHNELDDKINSDDSHMVDVYHLEDAVWVGTKSNLKLFKSSMFATDVPSNLSEMYTLSSSSQAMPVMQPLMISGMDEISAVDELFASPSIGGSFQYNPPEVMSRYSQIAVEIPSLDVAADYSDNENYTAQSKWGFLRLELNNDFGHSTYASRLATAAKKVVIKSVKEGENTTTTIDIDVVTEPYTPKVKEITIDYSVSTVIDLASRDEGTYLHVTPFGSKDLAKESDRMLLPYVANEGELFIGVENFVTDQTLSVLFQVSDGTADPLSIKQELSWHYLSHNNTWVAFEKEDIQDSTNDLTSSGIIKFSISDKATNENSLFNDKLHWLRATIKEKTPSVCKIINVIAQAGKAQFYDYKQVGNYFKNTLPASSISKLALSDAAIKKIVQPYASFGGKTKERDDHFYVRVSERLRHKNRSITVWDYERMVLEEYPEIYKVKCINHTQVIENTLGTQTTFVDNELKPGYVLVVPVPDLHNKNAFDPLRPYTTLGVLTDIRKYLYKYISPHVNLDVRNPRFEEIQLEFKVKFITEDNEFYQKHLKTEIEQFLAPWAYDPNTDIEFGGRISKSVLIDFIEERPYVDFLSCVKMYQIVDGVKSGDADEAIATSARSVFVSVKADDELNAHKITFISDNCNC